MAGRVEGITVRDMLKVKVYMNKNIVFLISKGWNLRGLAEGKVATLEVTNICLHNNNIIIINLVVAQGVGVTF